MSEITTASEYKKSARKIIELPSKHKFMIRRIPPEQLSGILQFGQVTEFDKLSNEEKAEVLKKQLNLMKEIIPVVVVSPKIVTMSVESEDTLHYDDLTFEDRAAIFTECFKFSGLTAEEAEKRESFREQSAG